VIVSGRQQQDGLPQELPVKLGKAISWLRRRLQAELFPRLEECWETPLTEKEQKLVGILELVELERFVVRTASEQWLGRKLKEREAIARSFVAKAVYGYLTTRILMEAVKTSPSLRLICGFDRPSAIPSESTFSRAFAEFAEIELGQRVHDAMVERFLKPELVGHISRDATAIEGREKPVKKLPKEKPAPRKRGRPARGEQREPKKQTRLERQRDQSAEEALTELPVLSDCGSKQNSKGFKETWIGYKLHADVNDCGLPVSVVLTAASVHDSQVAIPLMKMSSAKVDYLYDLMDSAYDAGPIYEISRSLSHVPIIDKNSRRKEVLPMAPHEAARYNERTAVERFNSRLKEEFGGRNVMVRGARKVMMHLMFGVVAIFADQLLKLAT
jgi:IS5 family transposase